MNIRLRGGRSLDELNRAIEELENDAANLGAHDVGPDHQRLLGAYRSLISKMERTTQDCLVGVPPGHFYTDRYRMILEAPIKPSNLWSEADADVRAQLVWLRDQMQELSSQDQDALEEQHSTPSVLHIGTIDKLHAEVVASARALFVDGHYSQAVFETLKALEQRVRNQSGLHELSGRDLMSLAFRPAEPVVSLAVESGRSGRDEQEGLQLVFMGVMQGLRNPKAHGFPKQDDPQRALEYLALVSVLFRRLDDATN